MHGRGPELGAEPGEGHLRRVVEDGQGAAELGVESSERGEVSGRPSVALLEESRIEDDCDAYGLVGRLLSRREQGGVVGQAEVPAQPGHGSGHE